jgi:hypothetical protein
MNEKESPMKEFKVTDEDAKIIDLMVAITLKQLETCDIMLPPTIDFSDLKIKILVIRQKARAFVMPTPEVKTPDAPVEKPKGSLDDVKKD